MAIVTPITAMVLMLNAIELYVKRKLGVSMCLAQLSYDV